MTIGEKIKNKREKLGMNQKDLALKIGYKDPTTINKVEKGAAKLPKNKVKALADVLGIDFFELMSERNVIKSSKTKTPAKKANNTKEKDTKATKEKDTKVSKPKEVKVEIVNTEKLFDQNEKDDYDLLLERLDELSDDEIKKVLKFVDFAIFYKDN